MKTRMELLAPGGDTDAIKTAILAGADAVYCGLHVFNARNRAVNIEFEDLQGLLRLAHKHDCKIFLTLNIVFLQSEFPAVFKLLNRLVNTTIDGIIVQDFGLFYILTKYFPTLKIHASTQVTTHNEGQLKFLKRFNVERVNLCRELNISEIKALSKVAHENSIDVEFFVHGSYCVSFSGLCYMSSVHGGRSGNRGRCSQPCREEYAKTELGNDFPLNLKDNSAWFDLKELYDAGVDSLKIEGRIKNFDYVHTVVTAWRKQIDSFMATNSLLKDNRELYKAFNRDFTNAFLTGDLNDNMFIDNPMGDSAKRLSKIHGFTTDDELVEEQNKLYDEKELLKNSIKAEIDRFNINKIPLSIFLSGKCGYPLKVVVESYYNSYEFFSESVLIEKGKKSVDSKAILSKFNAINDTDYYLDKMEVKVEGEIYLPFSEITAIKNKILYVLNGEKDAVAPVSVPVLKRSEEKITQPTLSVLISDFKDLDLSYDTSINVFFQLPNSIENIGEYVDMFHKYQNLIPWFPSVLIGNDYDNAVELLKLLKPKLIVTNNSGIANEAFERGISWIAGPNMNITNSYSLLALKEKFNCYGSFISNEVTKNQMNSICKPDGLKLFFSIYHPVQVMTSRACFFRTVTGCDKKKMDRSCLSKCVNHASITDRNNEVFYIEKSKGCYNSIYSPYNLLNSDIIADRKHLFDGYFINLSEIKTETKVNVSKTELIGLFKDCIGGELDADEKLKQNVYPTCNSQYMARII